MSQWRLSQEAQDARLMFLAVCSAKAGDLANAPHARRVWLASMGMQGEQRETFWIESLVDTVAKQ